MYTIYARTIYNLYIQYALTDYYIEYIYYIYVQVPEPLLSAGS